jgi:hypothetical protein
MKDDKNDRSKFPSYEIGYGKPPLDRPFLKGKSGNPQGRPKKKAPDGKVVVDRSTGQQVLKAARQEVTVREGDKTKSVTAIEAIIQACVFAAIKGKTHAQKHMLELVDRYLKEEAVEIHESNEVWRNYVANYDKIISSMQKSGETVPEDWPHPDDIVFEDGQYTKFVGGEPAIAAQNRKLIMRFRDLLILQAEMDRRCFARTSPGQKSPMFASEFFIFYFNWRLPTRMQLDNDGLLNRAWSILTLRKAELQQQLKHAWAEFGFTAKANATTPPLFPLLAKFGIDVSEIGAVPAARRQRRYKAQRG